MKSDLLKAGLCINETKSVWRPSKKIRWLGVDIDLGEGLLSTPQEKREGTLRVARGLISQKRASARQLAGLAGKVISMRLVLGDLAVIGTKRMCRQIAENVDRDSSWDWHYEIEEETKQEIAFWIRSLIRPEVPRSVKVDKKPELTVYSDASAVAAGAFIDVLEHKICKNFSEEQKKKSSAWRELKIVQLGMEGWEDLFQGKGVTWCTDNKSITYIVKKGSMKMELNYLAAQILLICARADIDLKLTWIPREENKKADAYSREVDMDDWEISDKVFQSLEEKFGPHNFDRFADSQNRKCKRFSSLNWEKGSQGIDALSFNWGNYNNWVVPPPNLLARTVNHMQSCRARGTLMMPEWPSNVVWPLLMPDRKPANFIKEIVKFGAEEAIVKGTFEKSVFTNGKLKADILAFRIDFGARSI